jgi:hypothetical protein
MKVVLIRVPIEIESVVPCPIAERVLVHAPAQLVGRCRRVLHG